MTDPRSYRKGMCWNLLLMSAAHLRLQPGHDCGRIPEVPLRRQLPPLLQTPRQRSCGSESDISSFWFDRKSLVFSHNKAKFLLMLTLTGLNGRADLTGARGSENPIFGTLRLSSEKGSYVSADNVR